ncbi:hypothetical protein HIM_04166 [Hirsutella minnesotensis 3608]|uniref:Tyrosinase copper-binding domain-containing protein n=1 Tax=Hirsutella minnesotensis 3608 TaxID=1043627 RepID=A0A0F8A1R3_9HYPO|nr:hypothetical protein HIM_04166 [Hirsutella minnesotensis 3608]
MLHKGAIALLTLAAALGGLAQGPRRVPVTGVPVSQSGAVPLRRSINDLQAAGGPQWDLYLLALLALQQDPDDRITSYFQLAGIHGAPYIEWNGAGAGVNGDWRGYCPHNENLFLSWHRAYVVLFEQVLVDRATQIANTYPQSVRARYVRAAQTLRAPYWDWAASPQVPPALVPDTVSINYTSSSGNDLQTFLYDNPLRTYKIPQAVLNGKYGPFDPRMRPQVNHCPAPDTYPASANALLANNPYRQWTYDVLTRARDFTEFSLSGPITSLEQIHNQVHWDAACGEQFLDVSLTAFDPLFMLHHANVDRLWAYWQAIRPEQDVFQTPYLGLARFSTPRGTTITSQSPLQPFFNAAGAFHTTLSVRAIWDFGYSYQGLEWWRLNEEQMRQEATRLINQLYNFARPPPPSRGSQRREEQRKTHTTRYFAHVELDVAQVERPCMVKVYHQGQQAGSLVLMAHRPVQGLVKTGFGLDKVVEEKTMEVMLDANTGPVNASMEVEIVKSDGSRIPLHKVSSLGLEVEVVEVKMPTTDDELPKYGKSRRFKTEVAEKSKV